MAEQLPLENFGEVPFDRNTVALIVKLLDETTNLDVVRGFLKSKGEHFSAGSWQEMHDKRIVPAVRKGAVTVGELVALLAQAEEFGGTHSFLFKCSAANARHLLTEESVKAAVKKMGLADILENPRVLDQPQEATVSAVRWDTDKRGRCLVAKVIERRQKLVPQPAENGEANDDGEFVEKRWRKVPVRTVNVMRLYASGLLEVRIQAHSHASDYTQAISSLWNLLSALFPPAGFDSLSLAKAKNELYRRKDEFKSLVRFSDSTLRDDMGAVITAGTGSEQSSLFANKCAAEGVGAFLKAGGHCDEFNIWWLAQKNALPSADIHMLISGQPNEFSVTGSCSKDDFEYAFDRLYELA